MRGRVVVRVWDRVWATMRGRVRVVILNQVESGGDGDGEKMREKGWL